MCASSCWNLRTRVSPVRAPESSFLWSTPKSANRRGSSRQDLGRWSNIRLKEKAKQKPWITAHGEGHTPAAEGLPSTCEASGESSNNKENNLKYSQEKNFLKYYLVTWKAVKKSLILVCHNQHFFKAQASHGKRSTRVNIKWQVAYSAINCG